MSKFLNHFDVVESKYLQTLIILAGNQQKNEFLVLYNKLILETNCVLKNS